MTKRKTSDLEAVRKRITEAAEHSRAALAEAERIRGERSAESDAAAERLSELRGRANRGDASVTAAELRTTKQEAEDAAELAAGAAQAVKRAQRALVNDDVSLAEAVGPMVSDAVGFSDLGLRAAVLPVEPGEPPSELPALFVVQSQPSVLDRSGRGFLSGQALRVVYFRHRLHAPLTAAAIERHAVDHNVRLGIVRSESDAPDDAAGVYVDRLVIEVKSAWPDLPVLTGAVQSHTLRAYADGIAAQAERWMDSPTLGQTARVTASECSLVSANTDASGRQVATVRVSVTGRPSRGGAVWSGDDMRDRLLRTIESQRGKPASGIGRVQAVEIERVEPAGQHGRTVTARLTVAARLADARAA